MYYRTGSYSVKSEYCTLQCGPTDVAGPTDVGVKMGFKPRVTLGTLLNQLILE